MSSDRFYQGVRLVGRFWLWFFFRDVEVVRGERVPASGPVLLCINHPNNLIDSLLVGAILPRKVHYLATASLFRNPLVARFLLACGAIPVYRKQDDPEKMDKNVEAFAACFRALEQGRLIGIYPEGTTHSESRVQRIKTGAARIGLDYQASGRGAPLTLMPVGLTFEARKAFRGHVRISFGEPIALPPYAAVYQGRRGPHHGHPVGHGGRDPARGPAGAPGPDPRRRGDLPERPDPRAAGRARPRSAPDRSPAPLPRHRGRGGPLRGARPRAGGAAVGGSPAVSRLAGRVPGQGSGCARPRPALPGPRPVSAVLGGLDRPALLRVRPGRQRAPLSAAALAGPPHRPQGDRLRHHPAPGQHRGVPSLLGARDLDRVAAPGAAVGARLRALPAGQRPPRVPVPGRPEPAAEPAPLRDALPHPPPFRDAAPGRAPGAGGRAGARQGRLPGGHAGEQLW